MRVAVIDRSTSVRGLLRRIVVEAEGMEVGVCVSDIGQGLGLLRNHRHDVAVIGLHPVAPDTIERVFKTITSTVVPLLVLAPPLSALEWNLARRKSDNNQMRRVVVLAKPDRPDGWEGLRLDLPNLVRDLGRLDVGSSSENQMPDRVDRASELKILAIGASAGGPAAVCETLHAIGENLRHLAVVIVQHIEAGFTDGFVNWLARELRWSRVALARNGESLRAGKVRVAPANAHLKVDHRWRLIVDDRTPARQGHRPSVDVLFEALAECCPSKIAAILLSGMGVDGVEGLLALRQAGALTFAQDAASSAVFGMPRTAIDRGAAMIVLPPTEIGRTLSDAMAGRPH